MNISPKNEQVLCVNAQNEILRNWDEVRTAYHVARLGTLSAAAAYLGVHHATVIRHIDALEAQLGGKLFQRHARGYTPTKAGHDLMVVAAATEGQFSQLAGRVRGENDDISGNLIVTMLSGMSPLFVPLFVDFQRRNPGIVISLIEDDRPLRLEYGEAHVALRAGTKPQEPDNIVQKLIEFQMAPFAHKDYVARFGKMTSDASASEHRFAVGTNRNARAPFGKWLRDNVPESAIVFEAGQMRSVEDAIHAGAGIGFLSLWSGRANPDLVEMMPPRAEWSTVLWLVTHVDLHRSAKIQAFLQFIKDQMGDHMAEFQKGAREAR